MSYVWYNNWPYNYSIFPSMTDHVDPVNETYFSGLHTEIENIENELGLNPSGDYDTVKDRLNDYTNHTTNYNNPHQVSLEQARTKNNQISGAIDFNKNEGQNLKLHNLSSAPASPVAGQVYYNTTDNKTHVWNGTAWEIISTPTLEETRAKNNQISGPIDFNKNEGQNLKLHNLSSAPASPVAGQVYYNTADNKTYVWNGTAWELISTPTLEQVRAKNNQISGAIDFNLNEALGLIMEKRTTDPVYNTVAQLYFNTANHTLRFYDGSFWRQIREFTLADVLSHDNTAMDPINFNKHEAQNMKIQNLDSAPSNPATGQVYFDTTYNTLYTYDGTNWQKINNKMRQTLLPGAATLPNTNFAELQKTGTGYGTYYSAFFDPNTSEYLFYTVPLTTGNKLISLKFTVHSRCNASAGAAILKISVTAYKHDDAWESSPENAYVNITIEPTSTAGDILIDTGTITFSQYFTDAFCRVQVMRDATNASDTLTTDLELLGICMEEV